MSKQLHSTKVPAIMQDYYNIITQVTGEPPWAYAQGITTSYARES